MAGSHSSTWRTALVLAAACMTASYATVTVRIHEAAHTIATAFQDFSRWFSVTIIEPVRAAFKRVLSRFEVALLMAGPTPTMVAMRDYTMRQVRRFRPVVLPQWRMAPST